MEIIKKITSSKKFWYAMGTMFIFFFSDSIGINDQEIQNVTMVAIALLISQGLADNKCQK